MQGVEPVDAYNRFKEGFQEVGATAFSEDVVRGTVAYVEDLQERFAAALSAHKKEKKTLTERLKGGKSDG